MGGKWGKRRGKGGQSGGEVREMGAGKGGKMGWKGGEMKGERGEKWGK